MVKSEVKKIIILGLTRLSQVRGKIEDYGRDVAKLRRGQTGDFDKEIGQTGFPIRLFGGLGGKAAC
ncbi:MAG: hypothetical protein PHI73_01275 [Patescibacteria group bacterium]|nr:hypothetical protein [Patescibacteria group bacterium]